MSDWQLWQLMRAYWSLAAIAALGLFGVAILVSLLAAWRRYGLHRRQLEARRAAHRHTEMQDLWRLGGKRLASMLPPTPNDRDLLMEDDENLDEDDDDDDDDEDEDREWWQKG
ncbi:MAG: hypothetical protein IT445_06675 [Phycisphaeraceae bacterium]|nr:hypothetical protein [Phycisphaeraceae bacterium]